MDKDFGLEDEEARIQVHGNYFMSMDQRKGDDQENDLLSLRNNVDMNDKPQRTSNNDRNSNENAK